MIKLVAMMTLAAAMVVFMPGCAVLSGTGAGVVGTGAAYEINSKKQMDRLEKDYKAGKITKEEYEARKDQIKKGSLIY